jgi:hypothetical protein
MTHLRSLPAIILAAGLLAATAVGAPAANGRPTIPPTPPDVAAKMSVLFAKASPAVRAWVDAEARKLRPMPKIDLPMVAADARQRFASAVPPLTPAQADVLAAMALYQTAKDVESEARLKQPAAKGDLTPQELQILQELMDRKSQLEVIISNVIRRGSRLCVEGGLALNSPFLRPRPRRPRPRVLRGIP